MAKPYSDDFRQKVMQAIELDSLKKCEASLLFNISRNTINLWCQRKAETGDVKPILSNNRFLFFPPFCHIFCSLLVLSYH